MADTKSPSAFAPHHAAVSPQPAPIYAQPIPASSPQNITSMASPSAPAALYGDPKAPVPQPDAHAVLHNKEQPQLLQRAQEGKWQHGFWDCFSPGDLCFKSCCCPCFAFGKTQARLEDPSLQTYESMNAPCGIFCLLNWIGGVGWIMACVKRTEMRRAYNIQGSGFMDCVASCCCPCCVLMQMDKEVVSRQSQGPGQHGYQAPGGMSAVPPQ